MTAQTRYARSGDISIAYQVAGEGPLDVVLVPGAFTHLEHMQLERRAVRFSRRLASFARLITFDFSRPSIVPRARSVRRGRSRTR